MSGWDDKKKREDVTKVPGKNSGVTANDMVSGDPGTMAPGKKNLVQGWGTGVAYADNGAKCETDGSGPGCFMNTRQRDHLDTLIIRRIEVAQTNYKLALVELRVDKLMEKDEDLNWLLGLLFDVAGSYFAGAAAKALIKLKSVPVTDAAVFGFEETPDVSAIGKALNRVSDSSITSLTKKGFDFAGKGEKKVTKDGQDDVAKTEKATVLSYIEQLKVQCDIAFDKFTTNILASADDGQRVVIYGGLAPEYQSEPLYKAALADKIKRYQKSGVADIGTKAIGPAEAHVAQMYASKRCVWVRSNGSKRLMMYHVVSSAQTDPWMNSKDGDFEPVPDEFVEAALSLSEQKWGPTPEITNPAEKKPQQDQRIKRLQLGRSANAESTRKS